MFILGQCDRNFSSRISIWIFLNYFRQHSINAYIVYMLYNVFKTLPKINNNQFENVINERINNESVTVQIWDLMITNRSCRWSQANSKAQLKIKTCNDFTSWINEISAQCFIENSQTHKSYDKNSHLRIFMQFLLLLLFRRRMNI